MTSSDKQQKPEYPKIKHSDFSRFKGSQVMHLVEPSELGIPTGPRLIISPPRREVSKKAPKTSKTG
jgi:hypothetical protein